MILSQLCKMRTRRLFRPFLNKEEAEDLTASCTPESEWAAFVSLVRPYFPSLFPYSDTEIEAAYNLKLCIEKIMADAGHPIEGTSSSKASD